MTQALNYTPKAIEGLRASFARADHLARVGVDYLIGKLEAAEVFMLPDHGTLLDRSKPRPEVPGSIFQPAFPVMALEYQSPAAGARPSDPVYTAAPCSKRIALAWRWADDLPEPLCQIVGPLGEGVAVASIAYYDQMAQWMPVAAAFHMPFDSTWAAPANGLTLFQKAMLASGGMTATQAAAKGYQGTPVPILAEVIYALRQQLGEDQAMAHLCGDLMDEVNAYMDLCFALACKNVRAERHEAPGALNRHRERGGKPPLKDFHVLSLDGGDGAAMPGAGGRGGAPRSHLRRGHIRRITADRITWVNSTIVRGRSGFVDKAYAVGARS